MPSGKQILLAELERLSQMALTEAQLAEATDRFRAALLLHGSTADSAWPTVERVAWIGKQEGIQGPGLIKENIYLADLLDALRRDPDIPRAVKERYPELSLRSYRAGLQVIWLLLTQLHHDDVLASVENGGVLNNDEAEKLIGNYIGKLRHYRQDPDGYLGCPAEKAESEI